MDEREPRKAERSALSQVDEAATGISDEFESADFEIVCECRA